MDILRQVEQEYQRLERIKDESPEYTGIGFPLRFNSDSFPPTTPIQGIRFVIHAPVNKIGMAEIKMGIATRCGRAITIGSK
jgi:hypothetical protein